MKIGRLRLGFRDLFRKYFIVMIVIFTIASLFPCTCHGNTGMKISTSENINDDLMSTIITGNHADSMINSVFPFTAHENISPTVVEYTVKFTESGLAPGTLWSINFNGTTRTSTIETIVFSAANGTYLYSVNPVPGYSYVTPPNSGVTVNGSNVVQPVVFSKIISLPPSPPHSPPKQRSSPSITSTEIYVILGVILAILIIGSVVPITIWRKK
ncbi:MAG: hypothetical protein LVQ96_03170 [Thermoplasmatales archaeon]|nr:hypothetical protein [Thermoplasmatales archaeon]MCW6170150.1 hypothetical protein [Thermoplasmatales archaeon]